LQQRELAQRAGLNPSHVSLVEKEKRNLSVGAIEKVCEALGIPEPLFNLPAAKREDLKGIDEHQIQTIGGYLARFLLGNGPTQDTDRKRKRPTRAA
jgi:transcriptional regulator with XRE-family HTH domain